MKKNIIIFRIGKLGDTVVSLPAIFNIIDSNEDINNRRVYLLTERCTSGINIAKIFENRGAFNEILLYDDATSLIVLLKRFRAENTGLIELVYLMPYRNIYQKIRDYIFFQIFLHPNSFFGIFEISNNLIEWKRLYELSCTYTRQEIQIELLYKRLLNSGDFYSLDNNEKYIAIGVGTAMPAKQWPIDYFMRLIQLLNNTKYKIILLGDKKDSNLSRIIKEKYRYVIDLCNKTTIFQSINILEKCDIYVGNDTGTMHLAGFAGIRCVALFSARDVYMKWMPIGSGHILIQKKIYCEGCMLEKCINNNECMKMITVDEVYNVVENLLLNK